MTNDPYLLVLKQITNQKFEAGVKKIEYQYLPVPGFLTILMVAINPGYIVPVLHICGVRFHLPGRQWLFFSG